MTDTNGQLSGTELPPQAEESAENVIRITTWNIWGSGPHWEHRSAVILRALHECNADVVTLQEVSAERNAQAAWIADALGYSYTYKTAGSDDLGLAILTRGEIINSEMHVLPPSPNEENERGVLFARVGVAGSTLAIFTTHLSWRLDESHVRQAQVAEIARYVGHIAPSGPVVLTGDMNAEPDADEMRMLTGKTTVPVPGQVFHDAWRVAGTASASGDTWDNRNPFAAAEGEPNCRLDYVFVRRQPTHRRVVRAAQMLTGMFDDVHGSDHYGVVADIVL